MTVMMTGGPEPFASDEVAVSWLLRLRELRHDGHRFDEALRIANAEFDDA